MATKIDDDGLGEALDETLESYLTGDAEVKTITPPEQEEERMRTETSDNQAGQQNTNTSGVETGGPSTVAHSDDDDDEFPAGLIRGEPVSEDNKPGAESTTGVSDSEGTRFKLLVQCTCTCSVIDQVIMYSCTTHCKTSLILAIFKLH